MIKWRPTGWINEWATVPAYDKDFNTEYRAFEAGADAMYEPAYQKGRREEREALRKEGTNTREAITSSTPSTLLLEVPKGYFGTYVFIPDEKESNHD